MSKSLTLFTIFTLTIFLTHSQDLYIPRDVQQAYKKGTRSTTGHPGKNYWQNRARYNITITARPPARTIYGSEQIMYINNSPDTLKNLVFKLTMNVHKPGAVRFSPAEAGYITSGVHIDSFSIDNREKEWKRVAGANTVHNVTLDQPLLPNDSVAVFIKWHQDISQRANREGMIDSTTYFLAYFYPQIAVYDDYQGWDITEFNDQLELYNDFSDYTLQVQVPKNFLVWATGTLLNSQEVLQQAYLDKYRQSLTSDEVIKIATAKDLAAKHVTVQNEMNTWRFAANNVPDVALAFSDHFVWDATSAVVDTISKRRASAQAAYNDAAADFQYMASFASHSLTWFSTNWPGISYPYDKTTVFQGGAGMEYPMMVNNQSYSDSSMSRYIASHEIAHTYMPFYMGINEVRYPFMDEGWATTFEIFINTEMMGKRKADSMYKARRVNQWKGDQLRAQVPIITPATNLSGSSIRHNAYGKPSLGYLAVKDMLGDQLFKKCLHEYMSRWNGKHPLPWDFFNTFNQVSGNNLNWFWNNWFYTTSYIDVAVKNMTKAKSGYTLLVENIGGMAIPFDVVITYSNGRKSTIHKTSEVWKSNQKQTRIFINTKQTIKSLSIDGGIFMDSDESNNVWRNSRND